MKNKRLNISTLNKNYPIIIGSNTFKNFRKNISPYINNNRIFILTDKNINRIFEKDLGKIKKNKKLSVDIIVIGTGEKQKNIKNINSICNTLLKKNISRDDTIIALGGGVVGDITGFVSSIVLRGINYIQIPTTLLSQVDSSVGGKTGINHTLGKNMIGAFYQPQCVIADVDVLNTLSDRELSAGLAEVIKYGLIRDYPFFEWLEHNMNSLLRKKTELLTEAISRSCINKADVVSQDEFESSKGIRATLNLGHTFGHAIENAMGYGNWLHGEAVACGMVMAAFLSKELSWLTEGDFIRIKNIMLSAKLPVDPPNIPQEKFVDLMKSDKKTHNNQIHLVLQKGIGRAILTHDYSQKDFLHTLQQKTFS